MNEIAPPLRMLVVDDDEIDRERVRRMLVRSTLDVDIMEATSGEEALALIKQHIFDCVVLDNHLGDASGAALLPQLHRETRKDCPVIMVTGAGSEALAVQALQDGATDYLPKTQLNTEDLVRSVRRSVESHRVRSEQDAQHRQLVSRVVTQATTLRQRERDLAEMIDNAPAVMGYWDADQRCRFGNQTHGRWFDVDPSQLPGSRLQDVLGAEFYETCRLSVNAALGGVPQWFETTVPARHEQPARYVQVQLRPDVAEDSGVLGFYATMTDVTLIKIAQARAEELLRFSEAVIENSPIGISVFSAKGECVLANAAFVAACGENGDILGRLDFYQMPAWRDSGLAAQALATIEDGMPRRIDITLSGDANSGVQLACALARVDRGGESHVLLIAQNVTEQRLAHAALITARDAATSAARAKSAFLANMSHEIRTPMNAIVGLSRLALDGDLPLVARDYLDKVHTSAVALMGILDDVLDYSKIEAGFMHFEHICFNVHETLQRVADLFRARIEQKGIRFAIELSPRLPAYVMGDPLRLAQVLNNLVSNAVKFTDAGQVCVKVDVPEGPDCEGMLRFSVIDTGIGLEASACASLFEAFVQGDDSVTRRFGGTGLGLAICKRLVELMGGTIGVVSQPGQGSEFWFTARLETADAAWVERLGLSNQDTPALVSPGLERLGSGTVKLVGGRRHHHLTGHRAPDGFVSERAGALAALAAPLRGAHVLLAEDNHLNQIVAQEFLHRAGLMVTVVNDGAAAVQAVQAAAPGHFSAILMDVHMPVLDGLEATRRIRALANAASVPVIGMTAAVLDEDRTRCTEAGMVDHIAKPVIPEEMIKVLLRWVVGGGIEPPLHVASATPLAPEGVDTGSDVSSRPADLNLASARQRLLGKEDLLRKLLAAFVEREAASGSMLAIMLAQGEVKKACAKAHDLKGVAATLGAEAIAAAAETLEKALLNGQSPDAALECLQSRLDSGLDAIRVWLAGEAGGDH